MNKVEGTTPHKGHEKEELFFQNLKDIRIRCGKDKIHEKYLEFAKTADLKGFIDYEKEEGILQCTLSIKVDEKTGFIPFVAAWGDSEIVAKELQENGAGYIFYTHVDLVDHLCKELDRTFIERVYFKAKRNDDGSIGITNGVVPAEYPQTDELWYKPASDDTPITNILTSFLSEKQYDKKLNSSSGHGEGTFVREILNKYHEAFQDVNELSFLIICVDNNLNANSLTRVMFITQCCKDDKELYDFFNKRFKKIREIVSAIRSRFVYDLFENSIYEATKSAKAAIMSRNMSHNLGSHVMAYLKHHLSSVKDMLNDKILSQLFENEEELKSLIEDPSSFTPKLLAKLTSVTNNENSDNEEISENAEETTNNELKTLTEEDIISNVALPFLVGLGQFISYLQERQDFIATIATDYIPYYSTVNFKDFIYDELNNDKRYERHPDRQNLKPDNILLGNIARSEGLGRITSPTCSSDDKTSLHDIVLKFRTTFNGDPVERIEKPFVDPLKYYKTKDVWLKAKNELDEMRNYEVSLPGGIVGRQAVFSIIENIIRNAAKHGNWREKGTLEITLDIFSKEDVLNDDPSDLLKERLPNDDGFGRHSLSLKQVLRKYYCHDDETNNDLYFVTVTDNLSISQLGADEEKGISPDSLSSLRKALIEDYIDENSQMRNSNKGIKEMRISASWLRSIDDDPHYYLYDRNNYKVEDGLWAESQTHVPPVIYARISKDSGGDCHLQYIFCLVRPQKVAFISDFVNIGQKAEMSLRASSWRVFTPESFIRYGNKSFDIIVFDGAKQSHSYNEIRRKSSSRFICLTEKGISTSITNTMSEIKNSITSNWDIDRDSIKNAEILLYGQLAKWDKKEKILITDTKAESHFKQDTNKDEGVEDKITFYSSDANAKYRYITHLEDRVKFREHIINDLDFANQFSFSEGITGNNSTDRLVRNEKITEKWFFKHLHAMKQKVAIFDERIFSKSFGLEEADLSLDIFDDPKYSALKKYSDKVKNKFLEKGNLTPYIDLNSVNTKNYLGATYLFKGVFVFSIIRSSEKTDIFNLYGCQLKTNNSNTFSECIKYATLSWDKDNMMLNIILCDGINSEIIKDFNSISIHQGLLDKLYGIFGIKGDNQARENLTKDFYSFFVGEESIIEFTEDKNEECKHYFLPGMTIHSGRSKPSESDMPQRLPFVPFSAIEHAVLDCKYSLVELLDSARYE